MPSLAVRGVLFTSSYAPLLVLFALLDSLGRGWPSMLCAGVAGGSLVGLAAFWRGARRLPAAPLELVSSTSRETEVLGFFATYVVPFAAAQDGDARQRLALLLFLVVVAGLYLRADLFWVNPVLGLAGVRVFSVETAQGRPLLLLTRRRFLPQNVAVRAAQLSAHVHLERPP
ncbi:MAG TPA: hypothetical protein VFR07_18370 [Mycobacteriales bacterium]|nr:hypothetical protein [Mycobacteriales bacterium]